MINQLTAITSSLTQSEEPDGFHENARLVGCVVFESHEPEVFSRKNLQPVLDVDAVQAHCQLHLREMNEKNHKFSLLFLLYDFVM